MSGKIVQLSASQTEEEQLIDNYLVDLRENRQAIPQLAKLIIGTEQESSIRYLPGNKIHEYFNDAGLVCEPYDRVSGQSRHWWTIDRLAEFGQDLSAFRRAILQVIAPTEYVGDPGRVDIVMDQLNDILVAFNLKASIVGRRPVLTTSDYVWDATVPLNATPPFEIFSGRDLVSDPRMLQLVDDRFVQASECRQIGANLAAIVMLGSAMEGVLWSFASARPEVVGRCVNRPKDNVGNYRHLNDWTFDQLIKFAHDVDWIDKDVESFSSMLRDFRNLVHPFKHKNGSYGNISEHTNAICWPVVKATLAQLRDVIAAESATQ